MLDWFLKHGRDGLHTLNLTELCGDFTGLLWKTWAGQNTVKSNEQHELSVDTKGLLYFFSTEGLLFSLWLLNSLTTNLWDCFPFKKRCYALFTNVASPSWEECIDISRALPLLYNFTVSLKHKFEVSFVNN